MNTRKWAIGDWVEHNGHRKFIYDVEDNAIHYVTHGGNANYFAPSTLGVKHLPDCDSWTWQPPKPIEPPEGYRLLKEGITVLGDLCLTGFGSVWCESVQINKDIKYLIQSGHAKAYARKIEPKVRPMTRDEFLAAWKQRNFCPLIDTEGDLQAVLHVIDETEYDFACVNLQDSGWMEMDELASFKFASDETFLHVEE